MRLFLKYFFLGWLGLILSLSFPTCRISWLAILLGWGFVRHGKFLAFALILLFAFVYSWFSVVSFWGVLFPLLFSLLVLEGLEKHLSLSGGVKFGFALFLFWAAPHGWGWFQDPITWLWGGATILAGFTIPSLLKRMTYYFKKISPFKTRGAEIRESAWGIDKNRGGGRRPFGFERELYP